MSSPPCPVCGCRDSQLFFEVESQPVLIGMKCDSRDAALNTPVGDVHLRVCNACTFVWNELFDPDLMGYDEQYENSLYFSGVFREYSSGIVARLIERYELADRNLAESTLILDIGCGKGDFLAQLCEASGANGIGCDPSYEGERVESSASDRIRWIKDYFDPETFDERLDLITSRYVLEHIPEPNDFVAALQRNMQRNRSDMLYFEVPDVDLIIRQKSLWDVIYEHCSYFGPLSLQHLFKRNGFDVKYCEQGYGNQFVAVEASPGADAARDSSWIPAAELGEFLAAVQTFQQQITQELAGWRRRLAEWSAGGRRIVLWGAGAKTVSFLNMTAGEGSTELTRGAVDYVVDINPHKVDHFIPGTGQAIHAPEYLLDAPADALVIMNPVYEAEIRASLAEMKLDPEIALLY